MAAYVAVTVAVVAAGRCSGSGGKSSPRADVSQFQLRFRAPAGTKFESTERLATDVLDEIKQAAGPNNVEITLGLRRAYSPRRIPSTRSFCGPAARTKACCRWRSSRRRAFG